MRKWWDRLISIESLYGYFANPSKSWLLIKPEFIDAANSIFKDTNINFTSEGHRYLGSPIDSDDFSTSFIQNKVSEWVSQLMRLTNIAHSQPHAVYSSLTHGLFSEFTFLFHTTPNVSQFVAPIEDCLRHHLLPTITGQCGFSDHLREIFSLPAHLGGLGIGNPCSLSSSQYDDSIFILSPLIESITSGDDNVPISSICTMIAENKNTIKLNHSSALSNKVSS